MIAQRIRAFLRELFGSRLVARLEEDLLRLRADYDQRLNERDETIADLREQLTQARGKLDTYETVLIPISSPYGSLLNPRPRETFHQDIEPPVGSWQRVQMEWDRQQKEEAERETVQET